MRVSSRLLGRTLAIVSLGAAVLDCRPTSPTPTVPPPVAVDSATAVRLALAAIRLGRETLYPFELVVHEFAQDSVGYVITLLPGPESGVAEGGGGRVRVTRQGEVLEVSRFQ